MKFNTKVLGRCLEILFLALIPILILSNYINIFFPDLIMGEKVLAAVESAYGFNIKLLSGAKFYLVVVISGIGLAFNTYGLWLGAKIARLWGKGEFLTEPTARLFGKLKTMAWVWGLFNIAQTILLAKTLMLKMEKTMLVYSLAMLIIMHILLFILFAAIAAVIKKGAGLQKDQDLTV